MSEVERETIRLLMRVKRGDVNARERLVRLHTPLVKKIVASFADRGEPLEDLFQEGLVGLLSAIDLYDPSYETQFATYAYHLIKGQIRHYLRDKRGLIRQPAWIQEIRAKILKAKEKLLETLGREPTPEEIAQYTGLTLDRIQEALATLRTTQVLPLDTSSLNDTLESVNPETLKINSPDASLPVEDIMTLHNALEVLRPIERRIVQEFFFNGLKQSEISRKLGITGASVNRLLKSALNHLQEHFRQVLGADHGLPGRLQILWDRAEETENLILDLVTQTYHQDYFYERLQEEVLKAQRYSYEVALVRLHLEGPTLQGNKKDKTLAEVAQVFKTNIRRIDLLGRTGDTEFGILLPYTSAGACVVGNRLKNAVRKVPSPNLVTLRVSVGTAVFPKDALTAEDLFCKATPEPSTHKV